MQCRKNAQEMLLSAAVWTVLRFFVLAVSLLPAAANTYAATALSTKIEIHAQVLPYADLSVLVQPAWIEVTEQDIQRGFVEIQGVSALELRANVKDCLLIVTMLGALFKEMEMNINGRELKVNRPEALIEIPVQKRLTVSVNYRFFLSPQTAPGTYPWPVFFSVSPL